MACGNKATGIISLPNVVSKKNLQSDIFPIFP